MVGQIVMENFFIYLGNFWLLNCDQRAYVYVLEK
jgi:hypothetical protein